MLLNFILSFSSCSNCKEIAASFIVKHLGRVRSYSEMPTGAFEHSLEYRCLRFGRGLLALCGGLVQEALRDEAVSWRKIISNLIMEMLIIFKYLHNPRCLVLEVLETLNLGLCRTPYLALSF